VGHLLAAEVHEINLAVGIVAPQGGRIPLIPEIPDRAHRGVAWGKICHIWFPPVLLFFVGERFPEPLLFCVIRAFDKQQGLWGYNGYFGRGMRKM
jgi:hypothetical protein